MEFKVGDRVNVYADVIFKATITMLNAFSGPEAFFVRSDRSNNLDRDGYYFAKQCRKLVKKPIKFEAGDRCVIEIEGKKQKGTILPNSYCNPDYYVKFDDGFHGFFPIRYRNSKCQYVRKLVNKRKFKHGDKVRFKVGDRVVFKQSNCNSEDLKGYDNVKGTITQIRSHGDTVIALVPQLCGFINVKHLKKLVKKKKSEKKPFFEWMSKIILKDLEKEQKEQKLLPCPFCGCADCHVSSFYAIKRIICPECGIYTGKYCDEELAINHWNRRSYP